MCFGGMKDPLKIENGLVRGVAGRDVNITAFKGITYAEPPVNNLRWVPPVAPHNWSGVRNADKFSDACAQVFPNGDFPKTEDCLYLNIGSPAKSSKESLPVMVWIHGRGFRVGASREALYDGEEIARKGVVVVTLNYRLGFLGFFSHPELTKESVHHASGNYGLLDQLAALQWVQHNIAAFGGNPKKVTIFGQSAGAFPLMGKLRVLCRKDCSAPRSAKVAGSD
jgi:para-nitrobenzyl esterase